MQLQRLPAIIFIAGLCFSHSIAQDDMMPLSTIPALYRRGDAATKSPSSSLRKTGPSPSTHGQGIANSAAATDKTGTSSGSRSSSPRTKALAQAESTASKARSNYWDVRKEYLQRDQAHHATFPGISRYSDQAHQSQASLLQHQDRVISAKVAHAHALAKAQGTAVTAQNTNRAARNTIKASTARKTADKLKADRDHDEASLRLRTAQSTAMHHRLWQGPDHPNTKVAMRQQRDAYWRLENTQTKKNAKEDIRYKARLQQGKDSDSSGDEAIFSNLEY